LTVISRAVRLHANQRGDRVERVEEEVRVDLALQGVEAGFEQQALLFFELEFYAQGIPNLKRDANDDGRAEPYQQLQPPWTGEQRKQPRRMRIGLRQPATHASRATMINSIRNWDRCAADAGCGEPNGKG